MREGARWPARREVIRRTASRCGRHVRRTEGHYLSRNLRYLRHRTGATMTNDAFPHRVIAAALQLLCVSPVMAQTSDRPGPAFPSTRFLSSTTATWYTPRTLV